MLGYRKGEDGEPEIVPEEAEHIKMIFNLFLLGRSLRQIKEALERRNVLTPRGNTEWGLSSIEHILRNEKYCGDSILQKTVTVDCISKTRKANHGEAPMYLVENSHPAIINRDLFHRAQEELARRKASDRNRIRRLLPKREILQYALSEVLHCAECGSRYKRVTWNIRGKRKIVWRCVSRLDYGNEILQRLRHSGGSSPAWGPLSGR